MIGPEVIGNWVVAALVGVSASVITQVRYSRRDKKAATYLAMRIAISLEAFVIACSDLIGENERAQRGDDEEGPRRSLPELGAYPDSDDRQILDVEYANRVLALCNDLTVSNNTLFFKWDIPYGPYKISKYEIKRTPKINMEITAQYSIGLSSFFMDASPGNPKKASPLVI